MIDVVDEIFAATLFLLFWFWAQRAVHNVVGTAQKVVVTVVVVATVDLSLCFNRQGGIHGCFGVHVSGTVSVKVRYYVLLLLILSTYKHTRRVLKAIRDLFFFHGACLVLTTKFVSRRQIINISVSIANNCIFEI